MLKRILCTTLCAAGLAGSLMLLSGCGGGGVDKTGPAVSPDKMDQSKQQQYKDFMKSRGGPGAGGGSSAPVVPPPHG